MPKKPDTKDSVMSDFLHMNYKKKQAKVKDSHRKEICLHLADHRWAYCKET